MILWKSFVIYGKSLARFHLNLFQAVKIKCVKMSHNLTEILLKFTFFGGKSIISVVDVWHFHVACALLIKCISMYLTYSHTCGPFVHFTPNIPTKAHCIIFCSISYAQSTCVHKTEPTIQNVHCNPTCQSARPTWEKSAGVQRWKCTSHNLPFFSKRKANKWFW